MRLNAHGLPVLEPSPKKSDRVDMYRFNFRANKECAFLAVQSYRRTLHIERVEYERNERDGAVRSDSELRARNAGLW